MLCFAPWKKALAAAACLSGALFTAEGAFGSTGERAAVEAGAAELVLVAAEGEWPAWLVEAVKRLKTDGQGDGAQLLHVLVEVSVEDAHEARLEAAWLDARQSLDDKRDQIGPFRREAQGEGRLVIRLDDAADAGIAAEALRDAGEGDVEVSAEGPMLTAALTEAARAGMDERAMGRSVEILKRRLDQAGTREATIQRQGERRIAIEAPANGSAEELLALIGTNAKLSFHLVESAAADATARPGPDRIRIEDAEEPGRFYLVERRPLITAERLVDAQSGFNRQTSEPVVDFRFDAAGARRFGEVTAANVGRTFALVIDDKVIIAPVIRAPITGGAVQISGGFTEESAARLAILLRAGELPAKITVLELRAVASDPGAKPTRTGEPAKDN